MTQFFNPAQDAQQLKEALGKPRNIDTIISIAAHRSNAQRQQIVQAYYNENKKNIRDDFRSVFSGNFQEALVSLFYEPVDYDCHQIYSAMKGIGTNEDTLIEIIGTRSNERINQIKQEYFQIYKKDLEAEIDSETSGFFKKILLALLKGERNVNPIPDEQECGYCAKRLYNTQKEKKDNLQDAYLEIFTKKSREELANISRQYYSWYNKTLMEEIERLFSSDTRRIFKAIIYSLLSPSEYFAYRLNKAMKGISTKDVILIRVIISREEIDIERIKRYYNQNYGKTLYEAVKKATSGEYQKLLLELIGI
jgi:annexin A7/11